MFCYCIESFEIFFECILNFKCVKETKSFAFGDIDFKLVIKKQKTQEETLTLPLSCPRNSERQTCFRKEIFGCCLSLVELSKVNRRVSGRGLLARYTLCPSVSELPSKSLPALYVLLFLIYL